LAERKKTGGYPFLEIGIHPTDIKEKECLRRMLERVLSEKRSYIATYKYCVATLSFKKGICISSDLKEEFAPADEFITLEIS